MMQRTTRFSEGDIVRYFEGRVDWRIKHVVTMSPRKDGSVPFYYIMESGMSGRRVTAWPNEVRRWVPGER